MVRLQRLVLCCLLVVSILSQGVAMAGMAAGGHVHADGGLPHVPGQSQIPGQLHGQPRAQQHGLHQHRGSPHGVAPCPAHAAAPDRAAAGDAVVDPGSERMGGFASCADPDHRAAAKPGCSGGAACCIGAGLLFAAVTPGDGAAARAAAGPPCALPLSFRADRIDRPPQTSPIVIATRA